jgi:DNA-directed RNA polymerase I, II, and III subunit RPABC2
MNNGLMNNGFPIMTKYEKARILGIRSIQISNNSKVLVDAKGETDLLRIALLELRAGKLNMSVRRYLPDGTHIDIPVNDMIIP